MCIQIEQVQNKIMPNVLNLRTGPKYKKEKKHEFVEINLAYIMFREWAIALNILKKYGHNLVDHHGLSMTIITVYNILLSLQMTGNTIPCNKWQYNIIWYNKSDIIKYTLGLIILWNRHNILKPKQMTSAFS